MNKFNVYAVFDIKVEKFMLPWYAQNNASAIRVFKDNVNGDSPFNKHPEDYDLYLLGTFDEDTGAIAGTDKLRLLNATDVLEEKKQDNQLDITDAIKRARSRS